MQFCRRGLTVLPFGTQLLQLTPLLKEKSNVLQESFGGEKRKVLINIETCCYKMYLFFKVYSNVQLSCHHYHLVMNTFPEGCWWEGVSLI